MGLVVAAPLLAGGSPQAASSQATNTSLVLEPKANTQTAAQVTADQEAALGEQTEEADLAEAPVTPISTGKPLPPNVKLAEPVSEVIKLADSGLDESVMLAFVTNSTSTFNLGAEEIIYLNDIGISSAVVTAMIQRDQVLKQLSANAAPAPAASEPAPAQSEPAPAPTEIAPQPAYPTESYLPPVDSTYGAFYDSLAPYGTWVDVAGYGPCWQPTVVVVNPGWRPYCNGGRWVYTDCGWYWLSGYSWGWAPFHYGRWFRHQSKGWCWTPGNVWGPSWVCWRYTGNYCGWAPLPPAAGYSAGVGLTFHGQRVNGTFAFGLGVNSFSFVNVSHFSNPHLNRYALPRQQATQIYNQTVASTTIAGNHNRVVNRGIPVSRVAKATHTDIRRIGIHEANAPAAQGARGEWFDAGSRTLSAFRPHFPESTGTRLVSGGRSQPGLGGHSWSELRNASSGAVVTPTSALTAPRVAPDPPMRAFGGTTTTQPNTPSSFGTRVERPATRVIAAPTPATGSAPTPDRRTSNPAPRPVAPIILRGSDRSGQTAAGSSTTVIKQATPSSPVVVIGRGEGSRPQAVSRPSTPAAEATQSRPTAAQQDTSSRMAVTPRSHPFMTAEVQGLLQPRSYTPRPVDQPVYTERPRQNALSRPSEPPARSQPQRQYTTPGYSAPAQVARSAPAPAVALQPMRSYSPPPSAFIPRAQVTESRPASPAPTAPASSSSGRSQSSSGRGWR